MVSNHCHQLCLQDSLSTAQSTEVAHNNIVRNPEIRNGQSLVNFFIAFINLVSASLTNTFTVCSTRYCNGYGRSVLSGRCDSKVLSRMLDPLLFLPSSWAWLFFFLFLFF